MTVSVQCTFEIEVKIDSAPEGWELGLQDWIVYKIEENDCPSTGDVGKALNERMKEAEERGVCWACGLKGRNKVLEIRP